MSTPTNPVTHLLFAPQSPALSIDSVTFLCCKTSCLWRVHLDSTCSYVCTCHASAEANMSICSKNTCMLMLRLLHAASHRAFCRWWTERDRSMSISCGIAVLLHAACWAERCPRKLRMIRLKAPSWRRGKSNLIGLRPTFWQLLQTAHPAELRADSASKARGGGNEEKPAVLDPV